MSETSLGTTKSYEANCDAPLPGTTIKQVFPVKVDNNDKNLSVTRVTLIVRYSIGERKITKSLHVTDITCLCHYLVYDFGL